LDADLVRRTLYSGHAGGEGSKLIPAQERVLADFLTKAAGVFFGGDATSVGVGLAGDVPTVYVVSQYAKDVDFAAGLKGLVDDARRFAAANRSDLTTQTYAASDGSRVTRVRVKGSGPDARPICLDAVQKGRTVLLAAGASETHAAIDGLLAAAAKSDGDMKAVAEGWVDVGTAANALAGLDKDAAGAFKGQRLAWTAGATTGPGPVAGLTVDVTAPPALVTALARLVTRADARNPPNPGAPPKPPAAGGGSRPGTSPR
jgi:hypothetical protein